MILVTGGAGFIGRNLVRMLLEGDDARIHVVDDARYRDRLGTLDRRIAGFTDRHQFARQLREGGFAWHPVSAVVHLGARTDTTERDWNGVLDDNYHFSVALLERCRRHAIPLIYASSASVYGRHQTPLHEGLRTDRPDSPYAGSKWLLDRRVSRVLLDDPPPAQLVGLRPFNVYGPGEEYKGRMASVIRHFHQQLRDSGTVRLFAGSHGHADGEHRRDFIHVEDLCELIRWFLQRPGISGIFNAGTGRSASFNRVARAVIDCHASGRIEYIPMPADLVGHYQAHTEADLGRLRAAGCTVPMRGIEQGVRDTIDRLRDERPPAALGIAG